MILPQSQIQIIPRPEEEDILDWLREKPSRLRVKLLLGGPGVGKTCLLNNVRSRLITQTSVYRPFFIDLHPENPNKAIEIQDSSTAIQKGSLSGQQFFVILCDHIDLAEAAALEDLEENCLNLLLPLPNVYVILAGRSSTYPWGLVVREQMPDETDKTKDKKATIELGPFASSNVGLQTRAYPNLAAHLAILSPLGYLGQNPFINTCLAIQPVPRKSSTILKSYKTILADCATQLFARLPELSLDSADVLREVTVLAKPQNTEVLPGALDLFFVRSFLNGVSYKGRQDWLDKEIKPWRDAWLKASYLVPQNGTHWFNTGIHEFMYSWLWADVGSQKLADRHQAAADMFTTFAVHSSKGKDVYLAQHRKHKSIARDLPKVIL